MKNLCIIADDLTGSTDTGVQFSKYGLRTLVVFDHKSINDININSEIISINGETRNMDAKNAYDRVKEIVKITRTSGFNLFYKKIDSTLRGHPGIEIEAMLDELGFNMAFIVPAFPDNGRIVENGYLYIKKRSSSEKGIQFHPIGYVPDMIKNEITRPLAMIHTEEVRKGTENLKQKIDELRKAQMQIFLIDAITGSDLDIIASAIKDYADASVIAGSAGLAEHISSMWGFINNPTELYEENPILFLAGTYNPVTAEQIKVLTSQNSSELIELYSDKIIDSDSKKEIGRVVDKVRKSLAQNKITIVAIDTLLRNNKESYQLQMDSDEAEKIASCFGTIAKQLASEQLVKSLIVTGGDTAAHVFDALGAKGMILENEILPGIPNGKLIGGEFEGLQVVTKAGGFGEKNSFIEITKYLNGKAGRCGCDQ